jgi:hypothetical protein
MNFKFSVVVTMQHRTDCERKFNVKIGFFVFGTWEVVDRLVSLGVESDLKALWGNCIQTG